MPLGALREKMITMAALFSRALRVLLTNDPLRMAGATAFFTTFALPPILIILIQSLKLFLDPRTIRMELFKSLSDIVGPETVQELVQVLSSLREMAQNWYITAAGFIFLIFVATTLFKVIKGSLNQLWRVRPDRKRGVLKGLQTRVQSLLVILVAGVLFAAGIFTEGIRAFIGNYIFEISPILSAYFNSFLNYLVSFLIVMLWFAVVFRYLPDGRPGWSIAIAGALVTTVLYTLGKLLLHWLLTYSNINTLYGTSASIVLILLFVFYSSLILYYGAAFTRVWAAHKGKPIMPLPHASHYRLIEAEAE